MMPEVYLYFNLYSIVLHVLVLQSNDPSQQGAQAAVKFLPLLIGYFALSVPSGLSLYW
jgi:membrane protein insertase Oxa1/YidC/SpoIIIJ